MLSPPRRSINIMVPTYGDLCRSVSLCWLEDCKATEVDPRLFEVIVSGRPVVYWPVLDWDQLASDVAEVNCNLSWFFVRPRCTSRAAIVMARWTGLVSELGCYDRLTAMICWSRFANRSREAVSEMLVARKRSSRLRLKAWYLERTFASSGDVLDTIRPSLKVV